MTPARKTVRIALVGDWSDAVIAHRAIPPALELAGAAVGVDVAGTWMHTAAIHEVAADLAGFDAVWVVPASPYASIDGALAAIRFARETGRPFLGTCGGFQHLLIEFARHVCGVTDAGHAEISPGADRLVITPLACSLVGESGDISFLPGSHLHAIFAGQPTHEGYHCRFGLNPAWRERLEAGGLRFTGFDATGEIRAAEFPSHPFFIGTLFQPERSALRGEKHPLIGALISAAVARLSNQGCRGPARRGEG